MSIAKLSPGSLVALLICLAVIYWIGFALSVRGVHFDEGISVLAAQSILDHGYPLLPSEFIYHRAYLHHYLLAGSITLFGVNSISVMLPSFILAIGSLILVYLISARILRMRWLGIAAIGVLTLLQIFSWYATSPRMYMALLFFTLLGTFLAWKGFIEGDERYQNLTLVSLIAAMLSHRQGIVTVAAIGGIVLLTLYRERRLRGAVERLVRSPPTIGLLILMGSVAWFVHVFEPGTFRSIVLHNGTPPDRQGLNLNYVFWGMHLGRIEEAFPLGLPFALVGLASIRMFSARAALKYIASIMILGGLLTGLALRDGWGPRVFFFIMPFYTLFVLLGVVALLRTFQAPRWRTATVRSGLFIGGLSLSVLLGTFVVGGPYERGSSPLAYITYTVSQGLEPLGLMDTGYGLPCGRRRPCTPTEKADYARLRAVMGSDDQVVSTTPMQTNFYLGSVHGWLVMRSLEDGRLESFEEETDEYFGVPIVDTAAELRALSQEGFPVWIIMQGSSSITPELWESLAAYYDPFEITSELRVYRALSNSSVHSQRRSGKTMGGALMDSATVQRGSRARGSH